MQISIIGNSYDELYTLLRDNLCHNNYAVRFITIRILLLVVEDPTEKEILSQLLQAERCAPSLQEYRNRLNILRRVETTLEATGAGNDTFTRYLIGSLFINFNLLHAETKAFLITNVKRQFDDENSQVLDFWLEQMAQTLKGVQEVAPFMPDFEHFGIEFGAILCPVRAGVNEKPDFAAFRDHIWGISSHFSAYLEPSSRKLMPMWFQFVSEEFVRDVRFQDLRPLDAKNDESDDDAFKVKRNHTKKMLQNCFKLFAKFVNPAVLYREKDLKDFAIELLQSPDGALQKSAVEFLCAYRKGVVNKYKARLEIRGSHCLNGPITILECETSYSSCDWPIRTI